MDNMHLSEIEIAPPSVVRVQGREFAAALADTPQFKAFEQAYDALTHRPRPRSRPSQPTRPRWSRCALLLMLNAVSESERAELERAAGGYLACASCRPILRLKPS